ncbi:MAG: NrtA/SsuA/CpmA family ABC transporter substrate-binding protein [Dehalococcoidia bacterium]
MTPGKTRQAFMTIAIVILIGISAVQCSQQTAKPEEIEKAVLGVEASLLPAAVWIAENKGYFEEEGLDLTIKEFDSGRLSFLAMLRGEGVDISTVAPTPIMFSSFDRQDFSILATFVFSYNDIKVIARGDKGITEAADLQGRKVGTPKGTTGQFVVEAFLIQNRIPPSEVEVVDIAPSDLPDALANNQVDAIVIWEPHASNARKLLGDKAIRLPSSDVYKTTFNFVVMNDFAQAHPETLRKFLRAIDKATDFVGKQEEESQTILAERLTLEKEVVATLGRDFIFEISLDQSLLITLEDEARWAIRNKLTDEIEVPNYLDYIYLDALQVVKPEAVTIIR